MKKLVAIGLLLSFVSAAKAGPIHSVKLDSLGAGEAVTIQVVEVGHAKLETFSAFAGVFNMTLNGKSFTSFCIDTAHDVSVGQTYKVHQKPVESGLTNGARLEYLYAKYVGSAIHNNVDAAALQIALWDLEDGGQSLLTGTSFRYTDTHSPIYALANSYIKDALAYTPPSSGSVGDWEDASANGNALWRGQSLIGPIAPGFNANALPTPAPAGILLAASASATLAGGRLLRRRVA